MNNYEGKLGEWLKYVQQQIDSSQAPEETTGPDTKQEAKPVQSAVKVEEQREQADRIVMRDRMGRITPEDVMQIEPEEIIANPTVVDRHISRLDSMPIFDDDDVPDVEEFLPFLKEPQQDRRVPSPEPPLPPASTTPPMPSNRGLELLPEGTGEPKPMPRRPMEPPIPDLPKIVEPKPQAIQPKNEAKVVETTKAPKTPAPKQPQARAEVSPATIPSPGEIESLWGKMPKHIQILFGQMPQEIAQNSYKQFKETRETLIERLLDPILSLEESARILNVCPTTVRRYTNRGALRHFRTAGNQRRFRLSDVLAFLEVSNRGNAVVSPEEEN